jgi:hypothetical protein
MGTTLEEHFDNRRLARACSKMQRRLEAAGTVTKCQKRPKSVKRDLVYIYTSGKLRGQFILSKRDLQTNLLRSNRHLLWLPERTACVDIGLVPHTHPLKLL